MTEKATIPLATTTEQAATTTIAAANDTATDVETAPPPSPPHQHADTCFNRHIDSHDRLVVGKTRIRDAITGDVGTVQYVGPVASSKDAQCVYAGITWDRVDRGKHNGSVACRTTGHLVQHFDAGHPTAGSFLKLQKLDTGRPLTPQVLQERYVEQDSRELVAPNNLLPHAMRTASGQNKPVEFLGELQLRPRQQWKELQHVSMRRAGLCCLDSTAWEALLKSEPVAMTELDVAGNLFSDWSILSDLLQVFSLQRLSLAHNRLGHLPRHHPLPLAGNALQQLNLNQCHITNLETLVTLGRALPHCTDLSLTHNDIRVDNVGEHSIDTWQTQLAQTWPVLEHLDLSSSAWEDDTLSVWAYLPALQSLSLNDNAALTRLFDSTTPASKHDDTTTQPFSQLVHLQMAGTSVTDWQVVDSWRKHLPNLQKLRLSRVPLFAESTSATARRLLVMARLPDLQVLNGSTVTEHERKEAARAFLRQHGVGDDNRELAQLWLSRYPELAPTPANANGTGASQSRTLQDSVLNLSIASLVPDSCTMPPLRRRLPRTLPVQRLSALCARHFGLDPDLAALHTTDSQTGSVTVLDDSDVLEACGLQDGAQLFLSERAPESSRDCDDNSWQARMEQQEAHILVLEKAKAMEKGGGGNRIMQ